jgi:hypothetical protein
VKGFSRPGTFSKWWNTFYTHWQNWWHMEFHRCSVSQDCHDGVLSCLPYHQWVNGHGVTFLSLQWGSVIGLELLNAYESLHLTCSLGNWSKYLWVLEEFFDCSFSLLHGLYILGLMGSTMTSDFMPLAWERYYPASISHFVVQISVPFLTYINSLPYFISELSALLGHLQCHITLSKKMHHFFLYFCFFFPNTSI